MAEQSSIEWTEDTWNPIAGCDVVSPGCTNCYAMRLAGTRLKNIPSRNGLTKLSKAGPVWNGEIRLNHEWLTQPLQWKRPRMIFVCAHGDLFHEKVPDDFIDKVFAVMALAPQHMFQVLTKRSARMRDYLERMEDCFHGNPELFGNRWAKSGAWFCDDGDGAFDDIMNAAFPLRNVWLGVSAERQKEADERIPDLLATPAAIRFLSAEPLLGAIDLDDACRSGEPGKPVGYFQANAVGLLDWVIAGGESGQGARPMHPDWARSLRDQCAAAGVPFFFKQWGAWEQVSVGQPVNSRDCVGLFRDGTRIADPEGFFLDPPKVDTGMRFMRRTTKKAAGRLLDGIEHNGMPDASS